MANDAGIPISELRVDGGAAQNDLLLQMQADLLGVPVVRSAVQETTALGAAYLAGLGIGLWRDTAEISRMWKTDRRFEPAMSADERGSRLADWRRAVARSLGWARAESEPG
jgi:glycerol kinase